MDHELVRGWQLSISTSAVIPGGTPTLPGLGTITDPATQTETVRGGNGSVHLNTGTWPQCAYAVIFSRILKLTDGEIGSLVRDAIESVTSATGAAPTMRQMGLVIKDVQARAEGRADGSRIAAAVKLALSS
jgi:hypothetical protein